MLGDQLMPSVSPAQHRWIGWLHSNPEAREHAGLSAAKVDEWLHSDRGSPWEHHRAPGGIVPHYDDGGATSSATMAPTSAQTANPQVQGLIQRYASMPTEKLQELSAMMGGSQQGALIQRLLTQRRMMPQTDPAAQQAQQPMQAAQQTPQTPQQAQPGASYKRGGAMKRDMGGAMMGMSMAEPWWTRSEARQSDSGFLHGTTPGQADQIKTAAPGGSYVVPAEVVAGLGEGNSLAGARVMSAILGSGPYGTQLPRGSARSGLPRPPPPARNSEGPELKTGGPVPIFAAKERKAGGVTGPGHTPVDLSDGEYVIGPEDVARIGGGDPQRGIRILDKWVMQQHERHMAKLKKYKGPVRSS